MRFYRFVDPCPSRRRSCICMSTSTLPAYKASIEKHTDWTGRPSFSNATLPRPGTPSWNFRELRNNKASYNTCVPLMFSFACCFYINISRGHLGNRISLRSYRFAFNAVFRILQLVDYGRITSERTVVLFDLFKDFRAVRCGELQ